jgi:pimeloyl-ACP methyl ester carboxylesterase
MNREVLGAQRQQCCLDSGRRTGCWHHVGDGTVVSSENADLPLLATITAPTIVFHAQGDAVVPFEEGRFLAASIPGSTFVPLPSRNHLLLEHEPAWGIFLRELGAFLGWLDPARMTLSRDT